MEGWLIILETCGRALPKGRISMWGQGVTDSDRWIKFLLFVVMLLLLLFVFSMFQYFIIFRLESSFHFNICFSCVWMSGGVCLALKHNFF